MSKCIFGLFCSFLFIACQSKKVDFKNSLEVFNANYEELPQESRQFFDDFSQTYVALSNQYLPLEITQFTDWLYSHKEQGQDFFQYATAYPQLSEKQSKLYILQLGNFTDKQKQAFQQMKRYISYYYQIPVEELAAISLSSIDSLTMRKKGRGVELLSTELINKVLPKFVPKVSLGIVAITNHNLFPEKRLNYVFGQASAKQKTAVISLNRLGNLAVEQEKKIAKTRAFKVLSHEIGHLLGFKHCLAFLCNMNGANHLKELDRQPTWQCPDCLVKWKWRLGQSTSARHCDLIDFWKPLNSKRSQKYQSFLESVLHVSSPN